MVHEGEGTGYCTFWPTGKKWRSSQLPNAKVIATKSSLSSKLVVERELLARDDQAKVGTALQIEFELPTNTKRLDVKITADWDSPVPKREFRLFVPLAFDGPAISYDTLFETRDYDQDLPRRQHLYDRLDSWDPRKPDQPEKLFDWRNPARFVSAYDADNNVALTMSIPQGLIRLEEAGVSFTLIEDRTTAYVHMMSNMKGRRVFHTSITSHTGNWKSAKAWRFGWEHRGKFNPLVAVRPEARYPLITERGRLLELDGENLVLTALKKSQTGEDMIVRVYDALGQGDNFGLRVVCPYLGHRAFEIGQVRNGAVAPGGQQRSIVPLAVIKANEANLLEDPQESIDLGLLRKGYFLVSPNAILTTRVVFEKPQRFWLPTYEVRTGGATDMLETGQTEQV